MGKCVNLFTLNGFNLDLNERGSTQQCTAKTLRQQTGDANPPRHLHELEGSGMTQGKREMLRD